MANKSPIADPDFAKQVAEMFANGDSRTVMSEALGVTKETITRWRKDPRIKRLVHNRIVERVQRVTSKVDTVLEARLTNAENLTIKELLDIRREFMGDSARHRLDEADGDTINAAAEAAENPEFMEALQRFLQSGVAPTE